MTKPEGDPRPSTDAPAKAERERERLLAAAERIAHFGSWSWEVETDRVTWSDQLYRLFGVRPEEMKPLSLATYLGQVHPEDRELARARIERARELGGAFHYEHRVVRRDGTVRLIRGEGEAVTDEQGRTQHMVGICRDITEEREAEKRERHLLRERAAREAAEEAARRMEFLAEAGRLLSSSLDYGETVAKVARQAVPELADICVVFVVAASPVSEDASEPETRLLALAHRDHEREEALRELVRRYPPGTDLGIGVVHAMRTGESQLYPDVTEDVLRQLAQDGTHLEMFRSFHPRSGMIVPLVIRERPMGAIVLVTAESDRRYDDTDLHVAERLAAKAALAIDNARLYASEQAVRREAERATRLRDEMLAVVTHDLRSPLHTIGVTAELLRRDLDREERERHVGIIRSAVQRMTSLVQDLLDVSRIDMGRFQVRRRAVDPAGVVERVAEGFRTAAAERGVELTTRLADIPRSCLADPDRLEQALSNLVENALRHTPEGGRIEVALGRAEDGLHFSVADTGHGLARAELRELEERFAQPAEQRPHLLGSGDEGEGLGLTICQAVAEAHGGRMQVEAGPETGATFGFSLPLEAVEEGAEAS